MICFKPKHNRIYIYIYIISPQFIKCPAPPEQKRSRKKNCVLYNLSKLKSTIFPREAHLKCMDTIAWPWDDELEESQDMFSRYHSWKETGCSIRTQDRHCNSHYMCRRKCATAIYKSAKKLFELLPACPLLALLLVTGGGEKNQSQIHDV